LAPVLPLRGRDARDLLALVAPIFEQYGFDLPVTFTMLNERAMVAVMNVSFDKSDDAERERARICYAEAMERLIAAGYIPYRASLAGMDHLVAPDDGFWHVAREIKATLDPASILSPGRYIPRG
jgi:4-cresol dehydrogenase (hydroxylating)